MEKFDGEAERLDGELASREHRAQPPGDHVVLPLSALLPADSPRVEGEDPDHAQTLAEVKEGLPSILVHRRTMRVIDGMHRLKAAILRGDETIKATFFDGDDAGAFLLAVQANVQHGLPLTFSDRKAAAARILRSYPYWSDRAIAQVAGLSAKTVGAVRSDAASTLPEIRDRVGRDGRLRPLNTSAGRRLAAELIARDPGSSFREIARKVGISPSTVRDVRERLRRGEDPVPARHPPGHRHNRPAPERKLQKRIRTEQPQTGKSREEILKDLRRVPKLWKTEHGRAVLLWLSMQSQQADKDWNSVTDGVPEHCACLVADLAYSIAESWLELASEMRRRGTS